MLPAPVPQHAARPEHGHAAPGRPGPGRGDRRGGADRVRGGRAHLARGGRPDGVAARSRRAASPPGRALFSGRGAATAADRLVGAGPGVAPQMSVLMRHWELKLLALGVSMVLWAFVMTS